MQGISVFVKPWREYDAGKLAETVHKMGFDAIELPVREGCFVSPQRAEKLLPIYAGELARQGIATLSVAGEPCEGLLEACTQSGIKVVRVMFLPPRGADYLVQESEYIRCMARYEELSARYGVKVALQMHCGRGACNSAEMMRIVSRFDAAHIGGVWDAAHSGLAGEECEQGIDIAWSHLAMVNFKAAHYKMCGRGEDGEALYEPFFCMGRDGACSWARTARYLKARGYKGIWCMPAEYTALTRDEEECAAAEDRAWLTGLLG